MEIIMTLLSSEKYNELVIAWTIIIMCCMSNKALGVGSRDTTQHWASPHAVWAS